MSNERSLEPSAPYPIQPETYQSAVEDEPPKYEPPQYFKPLPAVNTQQPQQQQQVIYVPTVATRNSLTAQPARIQCPNCRADVLTNIEHQSGCLTWIIIGSLCATGLFIPLIWCGCQFIPCCVDSCKDVAHSCPNCKGMYLK
jgi:lipopolysaccharide-induced tumor necrosis factor-alpha factor